ncbi:MAG: hypothetical protein HZA24_01355 [Nitrospirae bacterium]|nr:hypothetical protein [Nitrospirota bacterium]
MRPHRPTRFPSPWRRLAPVVACALALGLSGCGPGGDNTLAIPSRISGVVKIPSGSTELGKPTLMARLADWLVPQARALTGMETAPAGVLVSLYSIDGTGQRSGSVITRTVTNASGVYTMTIPSWDMYNAHRPWVVAVGDAATGTLMRRLVDDDTSVEAGRDIDPASEAAVRLLVEEAATVAFSEMTPTEFADVSAQVGAAADAVSGRDIDEIATLALQVARESEGVQRKLVAVTRTARNTRPLARAGLDLTLTTGGSLTREAGAEDQDGDGFSSFQWVVDVAPHNSAVPRVPAAGRAIQFTPDVDGVYRLRLVVADAKGAQSPPDFATVIATTPPTQLTDNTFVDAEGRLAQGTALLSFSTTTINNSTRQSFADVKLAVIGSSPNPPVTVLNPGVASATRVASTSEAHPAISTDGTMLVYTTDMDHAHPGTGGSDFDIVASVIDTTQPSLVRKTLWVSDAEADPLLHRNVHDTQPDVQCVIVWDCTVVWVTSTPTGSQLMRADLVDPGAGFAVGTPVALTTEPGDHFSPRISADVRWVIYVARDATANGADLELFRLDLTSPQAAPERLTDNAVDDDEPAVDETGTVVVFHRARQVWLLNTLDQSERLLSGSQLIANHPSVSGDGGTIAFIGVTPAGTDLFTVQSDATGRTQLTGDGTVSQPWISADGTRILFRSARSGNHEFYLR